MKRSNKDITREDLDELDALLAGLKQWTYSVRKKLPPDPTAGGSSKKSNLTAQGKAAISTQLSKTRNKKKL